MTFSEILKYIRKQKHYMQEQFARELNVNFSTINRLENGRTMPSVLARMPLLEYCKKNCFYDVIMTELTKY